MDDALVVIFNILGIFIGCCIMGFATKTISNNKGYYGGFWWGFLLGIIGIIIVACKPDNRGHNQPQNNYNNSNHSSSDYDSSYSSALGQYAQEEENKRVLAEGGWKCANCHRANPSYISTCNCGVSKSNNVPIVFERNPTPIERPKTKPVLESEHKQEKEVKEAFSSADEILKLKQLLDAGVLTQDEFDAKKRQILGL